MINLNIEIRNKVAKGDGTRIVCNNSNYRVVFDFDDEWAEFEEKTLKVNFGSSKYEVAFRGNEVDLPPVINTPVCEIGVYAGDIRSTTPAVFYCDKSILSGSHTHAEPPEDIYNQLLEQIDKLLNERVGTIPQSFTHDERVQARANIKAAAGGDRTLAQTAEQGFVDLRPYTSKENAFTTPCDGYLQIRKAGTSGTAYLHVDNYTLSSSTNGQTATIFCGQGMKVWVDNDPSGASFIPWLVKQD